ncbi:hypothetical protein [Streptomyces kronopolitis]|uniref:hypothetical protein n=1 Tax=Streptomyces kronopolitis TaxID=1612435 RepID=UPI0036AFCCFA
MREIGPRIQKVDFDHGTENSGWIVLIAFSDHLADAGASGGQVMLKVLDLIDEWPEFGQLVFELPVDFGEFGDPLGQFPVADLVKLMSEMLPHSGSELIMFRAEFFDLLAGHGQVGVEAGGACPAALGRFGDGSRLLPLDGCLDVFADAFGIDEPGRLSQRGRRRRRRSARRRPACAGRRRARAGV